MDKLISFDEALKKAGNNENSSVLLGNGFSAAWNRKIFSYSSLLNAAEGMSPEIRKVFKEFDTSDFEKVISAYSNAASVCNAYGIENNFFEEAKAVREALVDTIAANHPENPGDVTEEEYESCIHFLSNFGNMVYTVNYDMLLYWVLMHDWFKEDKSKRKLGTVGDGFSYGTEEFLNWSSSRPRFRYLHGALHLFEGTKIQLEKLNFRQTGVPLKQQFIKLIYEDNRLPVVVVEGNDKEKMRKISTQSYLQSGMSSLLKVGGAKPQGSFFSFGFSFSENDEHILNQIVNNKYEKFFVGIYGDLDEPTNIETIRRAKLIQSRRESMKNYKNTRVEFFDAKSVKVWR